MVLVLSIAVLSSCNTNKSESTTVVEPGIDNNVLTDTEKSEGWVLLFDGDSINGWKNYGRDGVEGWKAENSEMVAMGVGGDHGNDLITIDQYENFEFEIEWNVSDGGNSGIFYNVIEEGYDMIYATGPEYQLLDDDNEIYNDLPQLQKTAANYAIEVADSTKKVNPAGQWNKSKIIKRDAHIEHWLNGKLVLEYDLWTDEWKEQVQNSKWNKYPGYGQAKKGHIGIQDHGGVTRFRNIKIRVL